MICVGGARLLPIRGFNTRRSRGNQSPVGPEQTLSAVSRPGDVGMKNGGQS